MCFRGGSDGREVHGMESRGGSGTIAQKSWLGKYERSPLAAKGKRPFHIEIGLTELEFGELRIQERLRRLRLVGSLWGMPETLTVRQR